MQQRANDLWIVRQTTSILVSWFVFSGLLLGAVFLWPQFQDYVNKLMLARQFVAATAQHEVLLQQRQHRLHALQEAAPQGIELTPAQLVAEMQAEGLEVLEMQMGEARWSIQMGYAADALWRGAMRVLSRLEGVRLERVLIRRDDSVALMSLDVAVLGEVRYHRRDEDFPVLEPVRMGTVSVCPRWQLVGRLGDALWLQGESGRTHQQVGDWLTEDWRIVGVHQSQLVLKSDIGTSCLGGRP